MPSNLFLLKESGEDNRAKRMIEEFNKINKKPHILNVFDLKITDKGLFYEENKFIFKKGDVIWSISNSVITKKLSIIYSSDKYFIWPSAQATIFSDKFLGNCFFTKNNIATPRTVFINKHNILEAVSFLGGFPCVIKRTNGSLGTEVAIVNSEEEIINFTKKIYTKKLTTFGKWKDDFCFILQEYIKESSGTDFRVLCLENKILGGIKRSSKNGDFRANVSLGGSASPFDIPADLAKICRKIMRRGNLFYAGLDFIKSNNGWLAIEVNTCAQFTGFEKSTGINVAKKIVKKIITAKLKNKP